MRQILITVILMFTLAPLAVAQAIEVMPPKTSLSGNWTIRWTASGQAAGKPDKLALSEQSGMISGNFKADSGESCPVEGSVTNGKVSLHVRCSVFSIEMNGEINGDGIDGAFSGNGDSKGNFHMERQICWLPEGCGGK